MNYISRLQADLAATQSSLAAKERAIQEFRIHLDGEKFKGLEEDGSRKDWIATKDVLAWLTLIWEAA
jgi:hypothetical protein